jgi:hypothetical protein
MFLHEILKMTTLSPFILKTIQLKNDLAIIIVFDESVGSCYCL